MSFKIARQLGTPNLTNEILFSRVQTFHRISSYPAAGIEFKGERGDMSPPTLREGRTQYLLSP